MKSHQTNNQILLITGPTCVGKTESLNYLAEKYDLEVLNMDSMQAYKFFKIGTGRNDLLSKNFHLYGYHNPMLSKPLELHITKAARIINRLSKKGELILLEGGSLTYLPHIIANFNPNIIAIESQSEEWLINKIHRRTQQFFDDGIIDEVSYAIRKGYEKSFILTQERVVYLPIKRYLDGHISYNKMFNEIKENMFKMHKNQLRFLKRLNGIQWFTNTEGYKYQIEKDLSHILIKN